ncbi:MAG: thiol-activated cytolysin family protein [Deltaproteobacteria bacterium]|nr:thiol-activated cytolysin family protein [Deltaproteobacteria bacterium]
MKYFGILGLSLLLMGLISACGRVGSDEREALRDLIKSIPKINSETPHPRDTIFPESIIASNGNTNGEPTYDRSEMHESVSTFEPLMAFDPHSNVLWPGSVFQGGTLQSGLLRPVPLKGSPSHITITHLSMPQVVTYTAHIHNPSQTTVNQAMQNLLAQDIDGNNNAQASFMIQNFSSLEHGLTQIGLSEKWMDRETRAALNSPSSSKKNNFIVKFTQNYYTASVPQPITPEAIFARTTKVEDAKGFMYGANPALNIENNPPMYISSVNYGQTMIFTFSSDVESSHMKTILERAFNGAVKNGSIQATEVEQNLLNSFEIKVLILGGAVGSTVDLLIGNKTNEINNRITRGAHFSRMSPGVPISYIARYLNGDDTANLSFTTRYEVHTSRPIPIKNFQLTFNTLDDDKDDGEAVEVWLTKDNQIIYVGTFANGIKWPNETTNIFTLPIYENTTLGLNGCNGVKLRIKKHPIGSEHGAGWNMALGLIVNLENGVGYNALKREDADGKHWGDGHDYDRTFTLQCK